MDSDTTGEICHSEFWDPDLFWRANKPHLTNCFQQSVLATIPCILLLVLCVIKSCCRFYQHPCTDLRIKSTYTLLFFSKLICSTTLIITLVIELIYLIYLNGYRIVPVIDYYSVTIRLTGLLAALVLQIQQKRKGMLNSKLLFIFWFTSSICGFFMSSIFAIITDYLDKDTDKFRFVLNSISYPIYVLQLVLSVFTDPDYKLFFKAEEDDLVIHHQPVLSRLLFSWVNRIILYGYKNKIKITDLDRLSPDQSAASINELLQNAWSKQLRKRLPIRKRSSLNPTFDEEHCEKNSGEPSLFLAVTLSMLPPFLVAAVLEFAFDVFNLLPALFLDWLIGFVDNTKEPLWHGIVYAVGMFAASATASLLYIHSLYYLFVAGFVPVLGLLSAVYQKSLKLSSASKRKYSVSEICNLLSVDIQKVFEFLWFANNVWSAPLRILMTLILLWRYLGVACLTGLAVIIFIIPVTLYIATKMNQLQKTLMARKDKRLKHMGEILNGIKALKLFAWEIPFMDQVCEIRKKEIVTIKHLALLKAADVFLWGMAPFLVAITSFVTFLLIDENNVLDPSIAFVSLTLFNHLRGALTLIPDTVTGVVQSRVSFQRLQKFLLAEEVDEGSIGHNVHKGQAIVMENASFAWTSAEENKPFLQDITIEISKGTLVGVVGQVGSGKSALLTALLAEMHITSGKVNIQEGSIAYVAQQAWIQNATLQENILFMKSMNEEKYDKVLDMCCLKDDLEILPSGDQTEIGEKGVNLSGGQKQRVSLARAVYQNSDVYLLDDPLSAVDCHVGAHIFSKVIGSNGILKNKTRVLVTHDLSVLPEMDAIFVMVNGRIGERGSYQELMGKGGEFAKFVEEHLKSLKEKEDNIEDSYNSINSEASGLGDIVSPTRQLSTSKLKERMKRTGSRMSRTISREDQVLSILKAKKKKIKLVEKEKMEEGRVKSSVFITYFRHASFNLVILMILSFMAYQGFEVGSNVWLSQWSTDDSNDVQIRNLRIGIYGLLGIGQAISILIAAFLLAIAATRASKMLHGKMMISILHSPMSFFEQTPIGRILNRFSKDISVVDSNIPAALNKLLSGSVAVIATVAIILASSPIIIVAVLPFCFYYVFIQSYYIATSRQTRRLQSVTLSPVMSNFSETVQGTSTIRAFQAENFFIEKGYNLLDTNERPTFTSMLLNRWISIKLELAASLLVLLVSLFAVFQRNYMGAGVAGLTLSYTLNITAVVASLIKFYTTLEIQMISVERIAEYSSLPSEASWKQDTNDFHGKEWPSEGIITFKDYQLQYQKSTHPALKGVNITILPREKVGIVGRTGAGKSSLTVGLFRIVEPCGGYILIDGVDISKLGLHELRGKLTILPQDPVLFSGTLRLNLDPLNEYGDEKLWEALEHAHLKNFVAGLGSGLEYPIAEGGENISVGQRQQICLARALLRKTKILVLDEATAAVDMETDRLIQESIRREFNDCTVLTIAHRLYTILDYDRIIVMDNGRIAEEGEPDFLLRNENSMFSQLAKDAGLL